MDLDSVKSFLEDAAREGLALQRHVMDRLQTDPAGILDDAKSTYTILAATALLLLLLPRTRRAIVVAVETVVAIVLVLMLTSIVVGLPIGAPRTTGAGVAVPTACATLGQTTPAAAHTPTHPTHPPHTRQARRTWR